MNQGINLSVKTKTLNFFRSIFKFSFFEKLLAHLNTTFLSFIIEKTIPPPYLYSKGSFRIVKRNGIAFKLDISDTVDHFIFFNYYDEALESFFKDCQQAKVILDIGANIGWTTLRSAKENPKARIIAFEPHRVTFERAQDNFSRNNFSNIELLNVGLGDKNTILKIYEMKDNNSGMNRIVLEEINRPFKEVKIKRLDELIQELNIETVDLIKIDVEGFEPFVLKGAAAILTNSNAKIIMETDDRFLKNNGSSAQELISLLQGYGYKKFYRADKKTDIKLTDDLTDCHFDMICSK